MKTKKTPHLTTTLIFGQGPELEKGWKWCSEVPMIKEYCYDNMLAVTSHYILTFIQSLF